MNKNPRIDVMNKRVRGDEAELGTEALVFGEHERNTKVSHGRRARVVVVVEEVLNNLVRNHVPCEERVSVCMYMCDTIEPILSAEPAYPEKATPTTRPLSSNTGPPLLPLLIAASIYVEQ